MKRIQSRKREAVIVIALLLLPLLFWWRLWTPNPADRAAIPAGDFSSQYYPLQLFAAREIAAGRLPAWDPYLNAGQPGLADIQSGFFYPLNLLPNLLLAALGWPFGLGMLTAQVIVHFALASLFTYLFVRYLARRSGARPPAARFAGAVAALTFTYAGYLTSFPVQQLTILETSVWLPLILLFLTLAVDTHYAIRNTQYAVRNTRHATRIPYFVLRTPYSVLRIAYCVLAALALACALLAGHPQTAMYIVYATLAYTLFLVASRRRQTPGVRVRRYPPPATRYLLPAARYLLFVACYLLLAFSLAAVQLIPTLQFIARSTRAGLDYQAVSWGFPLAEITHLLYPGYFGGSPQYVGLLPPILAAAALLLLSRARRQIAFWSALGGVAFGLAFGGHTFLYNVAYLLLPGFGAVRDQERIIYLFSFAVSVLAGYGALSLVQPLPRSQQRGLRRFVRGLGWLFAAFAALTALWYFGSLQGRQQGVEVNLFDGVLRHHSLLLMVLGGAAALFALRLTGHLRRGWLMALALGLIAFNLFTVNWRFNLSDDTASPFPATGLTRFLQEQPGVFRISSAGLLPGGASAGIVYELEDITGNTPLRLASFARFEERVGSWRRWQLLNVHYVLSRKEIGGPGLERVYEEEGVAVYRVGDPLPRAWLVGETVTADDEQVFDLLNDDAFDPRRTAVLPPDSAPPPLDGGSGSVRMVEAAPGRLTLDVTAEGHALLVVSQPFYPGWRATVDGRPVPILRVDYLLQGVPIPAGEHRLALRYRLAGP